MSNLWSSGYFINQRNRPAKNPHEIIKWLQIKDGTKIRSENFSSHLPVRGTRCSIEEVREQYGGRKVGWGFGDHTTKVVTLVHKSIHPLDQQKDV